MLLCVTFRRYLVRTRLVSDLLRMPTHSGFPGDDKPRFITLDEAIMRLELLLWCRPRADEIPDPIWAAARLKALRAEVLREIKVGDARAVHDPVV